MATINSLSGPKEPTSFIQHVIFGTAQFDTCIVDVEKLNFLSINRLFTFPRLLISLSKEKLYAINIILRFLSQLAINLEFGCDHDRSNPPLFEVYLQFQQNSLNYQLSE